MKSKQSNSYDRDGQYHSMTRPKFSVFWLIIRKMWVEDTEWNKKYTRQLEKDQSRVDGRFVSIEDKEQRKIPAMLSEHTQPWGVKTHDAMNAREEVITGSADTTGREVHY